MKINPGEYIGLEIHPDMLINSYASNRGRV